MTTEAPTTPKILRRGEAAKRLGVHPNTLTSWAARGLLRSVQMPGGENRYREDEIEKLHERIYAS